MPQSIWKTLEETFPLLEKYYKEKDFPMFNSILKELFADVEDYKKEMRRIELEECD